MRNPYQSPAAVDSVQPTSMRSLSPRRLLADAVAGSLVGATYASLAVAILTTARRALALPFSDLSGVEQVLFAFVAGALLGAILGTLLGGVVGALLGGVFRGLRLESTLRFYWAAVLSGSILGALLGVAGGVLLGGRLTVVNQDLSALIWCPLGGVLGGMLGSLAGRTWVRMVGGPSRSLPWDRPAGSAEL